MSLKLTDRNILIKNVSVQINSARRDADIFSWKESRPITYGFAKPYCRGNVTFLHSGLWEAKSRECLHRKNNKLKR